MTDFFKGKAWQYIKYGLYALLIAAAAFLFCKYMLIWFVPFIIAFIVARLLEPIIVFLVNKLHFSRSAASAAATVFAYLVVGSLIYLISVQLIVQLKGLYAYLPEALDNLAYRLSHMTGIFSDWMKNLPDGISETLNDALMGSIKNIQNGFSLPYAQMFDGIMKAAVSLPSLFIAMIATVLSTYFIASDYKTIGNFINRQLPKNVENAFREMRGFFSGKLWNWVKAQFFLVFITFSELTIGFIMLRIEYAGVLALIVALIDMLPILGVGTVLIPWGIAVIIMGEYAKGAALLILYVVIALVRNLIEPKIVGKSLGLHPLATLMSMYIGLQIFGFAGMILLPMLVVIIVQLVRREYIKRPFYREPEGQNDALGEDKPQGDCKKEILP